VVAAGKPQICRREPRCRPRLRSRCPAKRAQKRCHRLARGVHAVLKNLGGPSATWRRRGGGRYPAATAAAAAATNRRVLSSDTKSKAKVSKEGCRYAAVVGAQQRVPDRLEEQYTGRGDGCEQPSNMASGQGCKKGGLQHGGGCLGPQARYPCLRGVRSCVSLGFRHAAVWAETGPPGMIGCMSGGALRALERTFEPSNELDPCPHLM